MHCQGKEQKSVTNKTVEEVATAEVEEVSDSSNSSASTQSVPCEWEIPWSIV